MSLFEKLATAGNYIKSIRPCSPTVGIVLGSGLGAFVDALEDYTIIPYADIPFFKSTTVEGHEGRLIIGKINQTEIAILQGRLHAYEGLPMDQVVFPIRLLSTLGIQNLILTNAAGGINQDFNAGDLVMIEDHINFMGQNPLVGPNIKEFGPRFPDMTKAYNKNLCDLIQKISKEMGHVIKTGTYIGVLGPTYETPAEVRMLRILGADMVGMSTVPEAIAAHHMGIKVCGISCITNMAAGIENKKLDHGDIKEEALKVMERFSGLIKGVVAGISG